MTTVTIGKRFFAEVRSQYEDWRSAYVREALQNCIDAPRARNIEFSVVHAAGGNTALMFSNDGLSMGREEITGKLLALGETGKGHEGTVGGFGRAKELLYFTHESYEITSGRDKVVGSGGSYKIRKIRKAVNGTFSSVVIKGHHVDGLIAALRTCIAYSVFRGTITINGEVIEDRTNAGRSREWEDGDGWCRVSTNRSHSGVLIVRVGGVFMFAKSLYDYPGCVVCELNTSSETLTSNRDGLKSSYRWALDSFIESIGTNKRGAFKPKAPKFRRYMGARLSAPITKTFEINTEVAEKNAPVAWTTGGVYENDAVFAAKVDSGEIPVSVGHKVDALSHIGPLTRKAVLAASGTVSEVAEPVAAPDNATLAYGGRVAVKHDFMLRNELHDSVKVPVYYDPGEEKFSSYSAWLASTWAKCMVELHAMFEKSSAFSVGFVFDEDDEDDGSSTNGMHETRNGIGDIYYVAPCRVDRVSNGAADNVRKLVPRWTRSDKWEILTIAAHEFVHGEGYGRHNEAFASRLTRVLSKVIAERSRFNHCFRN